MPTFTPDEYAALLTRTFTPRFPRDCRPRAASDVTDKGIPVLEFLLPNPEASQRSITLSAILTLAVSFALSVTNEIYQHFVSFLITERPKPLG